MLNDVEYPARRVDWAKRNRVEYVMKCFTEGIISEEDFYISLLHVGVSEEDIDRIIKENRGE